MRFKRGFPALDRWFHAFEKGVHSFEKVGVHIYENDIIFILLSRF